MCTRSTTSANIGLRNGIVGYRESDIGAVLELRRYGYAVTVGVAGLREIDFVAERRSGCRYVRVAYLLESPPPSSASWRPLAAVRDAYPRVLLSLDPALAGGPQGCSASVVDRLPA